MQRICAIDCIPWAIKRHPERTGRDVDTDDDGRDFAGVFLSRGVNATQPYRHQGAPPTRLRGKKGQARRSHSGDELTTSYSRFELRQCFEQVGDQAVVRYLKDRRILVLVDRDNDLAILHAREVLNRPGNAHRDV